MELKSQSVLPPAVRTGAILLLALLPLLALLTALAVFRVETPIREQWYFMYMVEKMQLGQLRFSDLLDQEAEHRHLFPYMIMLALARLTHWNVVWETYASAVIATGTLLALCVEAARATDRAVNWLVPALSVIVYSLSQYSTWLWGFQMVTYLNLFAAVAGMVVLASPSAGRWRLPAAIALGVISCFSFVNGFLYWGAGGLILWLRTRREDRLRTFGIWGLAAAVTALAFFYGYRSPEYSSPSQVVFRMPLRVAEFFLLAMGTPLFPLRPVAGVVCGLSGLALFGALSWFAIRRGRCAPADLAFCWGLAAFSAGSGLLISLGRAEFADPLSERYGTTTRLFWIALLLLIYRVGSACETSSPAARPARRSWSVQSASTAAIVILTAAFAWRSVRAVESFRWYRDRYLPSQTLLLQGAGADRLGELFLRAQPADEMLTKFRRYRWGMLSAPEPRPEPSRNK